MNEGDRGFREREATHWKGNLKGTKGLLPGTTGTKKTGKKGIKKRVSRGKEEEKSKTKEPTRRIQFFRCDKKKERWAGGWGGGGGCGKIRARSVKKMVDKFLGLNERDFFDIGEKKQNLGKGKGSWRGAGIDSLKPKTDLTSKEKIKSARIARQKTARDGSG